MGAFLGVEWIGGRKWGGTVRAEDTEASLCGLGETQVDGGVGRQQTKEIVGKVTDGEEEGKRCSSAGSKDGWSFRSKRVRGRGQGLKSKEDT